MSLETSPGLEPIAGERGLPSVNAKRGHGGKLLLILLVGALVLGAGVWTALRLKTAFAGEAKAPKEVLPNLPKRNFPVLAPAVAVPPAAADAEAALQAAMRPAVPAPLPPVQPIGVTQTGSYKRPPSKYDSDFVLNPPASPAGVAPGSNEAMQERLNAALALKTQGAGNGTGLGLTGTSNAVAVSPAEAAVSTSARSSGGALGSLLTSSNNEPVNAGRLADRNFILPKGKAIDCILETAVVSSVAGMTTCVVTENIYSDNGKVVLIEKGTQATGEYASTSLKNGQDRLFVVWDRLRTPNGITINLNSPGTDGLGASGLPGYVDNHWGQRIGAALLLSFIQDAVGYAVARDASGTAGTVVYGNTTATGNKLAEKVLENTINIAPTLYKNHGESISIRVARDLNFAPVYEIAHSR